ALLAQLADGGYRDGVMLLEQTATSFAEGKSGGGKNVTRKYIEELLGLASVDLTQKLFELILDNQSAEAINLVEQFIVEGGEVSYLTTDILQHARLLLHQKLKTKTAATQADDQQ